MGVHWDFFRDKVVLVTGHTGFKGSWLAMWLKHLGARVVGFALPPATGTDNLFESACVAQGMVSVVGDIRNPAAVAAVFGEHAPDLVFHLAAQSLVRPSYRDPAETFAVNVMGTIHVLEAARRTPSVRSVVNVTSDKCYANNEWVWGYRENDPLGGHDPYSASKACAELVTAAYRASFFQRERGAAVASARAGNVIGGGDWSEDRLVPDAVRAVKAKTPIIVRQPRSVRPWQHVLEPLRGYLMLSERLWSEGQEFAQAWNFGPTPDSVVSVHDLLQRIVRSGLDCEVVIREDRALPEAGILSLDSSKARARLAWDPLLSLDESVALTVDWYRGYLEDPGKAAAMTIDQIDRYMSRDR